MSGPRKSKEIIEYNTCIFCGGNNGYDCNRTRETKDLLASFKRDTELAVHGLAIIKNAQPSPGKEVPLLSEAYIEYSVPFS